MSIPCKIYLRAPGACAWINLDPSIIGLLMLCLSGGYFLSEVCPEVSFCSILFFTVIAFIIIILTGWAWWRICRTYFMLLLHFKRFLMDPQNKNSHLSLQDNPPTP